MKQTPIEFYDTKKDFLKEGFLDTIYKQLELLKISYYRRHRDEIIKLPLDERFFYKTDSEKMDIISSVVSQIDWAIDNNEFHKQLLSLSGVTKTEK